MLWFVLSSVPPFAMGAGVVASAQLKEFECVFHRLLGISHLKVKMGLNVQGSGHQHIGVVNLPLSGTYQRSWAAVMV